MSAAIRLVPSVNTPGAADQDMVNRSSDPTPKDQSTGTTMADWLMSWAPTATRALASSAVYVGANYGKHKLMKSGKKDPAAIKSMSAGKIIKQGGIQAGASALSGVTYQSIAPYIPDKVAAYTTAWTATKPLLTGAYKTLGTMVLSGVPSFWNGVTDYMLSAGADYAVDWAYPIS